MDSSNPSRRLPLLVRLLAALSCLPLVLALAAPAHADLIDERNELIAKFINDMHADPLVADCAAHGHFVASTSSAIDHVEFPPEVFDSTHATITPWNDSFDEGKQRVKVDQIVTVGGRGVPRDANKAPIDLKFRCGYVGTQMLAFSWNDPLPPAKARAERPAKSKKKATGKGATKKSNGKSAEKATSSKSAQKATTDQARAKRSSNSQIS
jgi:hypothetical protein